MTISAKIIADSVNPSGHRITTFELEYPRFIHSEFMTHRDFSRNAASSRAIPIWKAVKLVWKNMAMPIFWGKKQAGMQASGEVNLFSKILGISIWKFTGYFVSLMVLLMKALGVHKQTANRMLEPWTHIKVVMTTTRMDNWEKLRIHPMAQPEIRELAILMRQERRFSLAKKLKWGEWHLPYVSADDRLKYGIKDSLKISSSSNAQVSYRLLDTSIDKALKIFKMLINSDVLHASPFEHPAQAVEDSGGSGNFSGSNWVQYRYYMENPDTTYFEGKDS
jgi:hypothetical protein